MKKQKEGFGFYEPDWKKEWKDMPEFVQEDQTSGKSIIVHFKNRKDMDEFAELIDQNLTAKTKSIWYPKVKNEDLINLQYVDEDES